MDKVKNEVFLLLGGNLQNVAKTFVLTCQKISSLLGEITLKSKAYKSAAWGFESDQKFLNQVLVVSTDKSPLETLSVIQEIELEMGRTRTAGLHGFESRVIDIDILYFNTEIINEPLLVIPHYALHERRFTLAPLAEISPNFVHPVLQKSNLELLNTCTDKSNVTSI